MKKPKIAKEFIAVIHYWTHAEDQLKRKTTLEEIQEIEEIEKDKFWLN